MLAIDKMSTSLDDLWTELRAWTARDGYDRTEVIDCRVNSSELQEILIEIRAAIATSRPARLREGSRPFSTLGPGVMQSDAEPTVDLPVPNEILLRIFSFLPIRERHRVSRVSKRWLGVISHAPPGVFLDIDVYAAKYSTGWLRPQVRAPACSEAPWRTRSSE